MGARGPIPEPTAALRARGSKRAYDRADDLAVHAETPQAPAHLADGERDEFDAIAAELAKTANLVTLADRLYLELLAVAVCDWRRAHRQLLNARGSKADEIMRRVALHEQRIDAIARRFGMTPSDRARLNIRPEPLQTGAGVVGKLPLRGVS